MPRGAPAAQVRALGPYDRDAALQLCALDPVANVYVAARLLETDLGRSRGALIGFYPDDPHTPQALCWVSANIVPVESGAEAATAFAEAVRPNETRCSSIFGPMESVAWMWEDLSGFWRQPLDVRAVQPLMMIPPDRPLGICLDPRVRPARLDEIDLLAPAAAAMFTEEIGYPPYTDRVTQSAYRSSVRSLVARGHSFVLVEDGEVVFKADVGSCALNTCQIQGVWVAPERRGQGLAAPAVAAVVALARADVAPVVSLYVNDFNGAAVATYQRVGFERVATFSTILM